MTGNASREEISYRKRQVPHPVLDRYYASERDRRPFILDLFDGVARYYDLCCALMSLGSGRSYRRAALKRSGLCAGMTLLDVAVGTGLVARAAMDLLHDPRSVIGLDPSSGMLREARKSLAIPLVLGTAEKLPFARDCFDRLSMGYALRHVADLGVSFQECLRVLKPGGRILILEISRPSSRIGRFFVQVYLQKVLPAILRIFTRSGHAQMLMAYLWDTIAECVEPAIILEILCTSGFSRVERRIVGGLFSEYTGVKPAI
jgi:demethylmenaquinone methyltransferase / 2-methoxy-6-polyprenyl-1,4-benzoquinol methylase